MGFYKNSYGDRGSLGRLACLITAETSGLPEEAFGPLLLDSYKALKSAKSAALW